jgi:hypothetical protein
VCELRTPAQRHTYRLVVVTAVSSFPCLHLTSADKASWVAGPATCGMSATPLPPPLSTACVHFTRVRRRCAAMGWSTVGCGFATLLRSWRRSLRR